MLKSYFKTALRYLWYKKTYSILNFVCLTFGLTCAIITVFYILNVFSYDKFHKNYNRLYSVDAYVTYFNGDRFLKEYLSASLTDVLKEQAPEIEEMTRIAERDYSFISGDKTFTEKGFYADDNFFNVFTFPLIQAGSRNVLTIAFFMALPISLLLGKNFLGRFYFHSPMPLWAFLAGGVIALVVALLTVSFQTWSVANRNPIKALRYE
jgi:ABC-type lipoprotein release transport system permease subunit